MEDAAAAAAAAMARRRSTLKSRRILGMLCCMPVCGVCGCVGWGWEGGPSKVERVSNQVAWPKKYALHAKHAELERLCVLQASVQAFGGIFAFVFIIMCNWEKGWGGSGCLCDRRHSSSFFCWQPHGLGLALLGRSLRFIASSTLTPASRPHTHVHTHYTQRDTARPLVASPTLHAEGFL